MQSSLLGFAFIGDAIFPEDFFFVFFQLIMIFFESFFILSNPFRVVNVEAEITFLFFILILVLLLLLFTEIFPIVFDHFIDIR